MLVVKVVMSGYDQQKINVYKGYIGERLAAKYLSKQGYEVQSYMVLVDFVVKHPHGKSPLHDFIGSKKEAFIEMNNALDQINSGKERKRRRFDFVVKKGEDYYVVEVKTNEADLSKSRKRDLQLSKRYGFIPMLVKTKVKLIADLEDVTVTLL
jgi:Holliday junction resolvase-like predicted endonuclease